MPHRFEPRVIKVEQAARTRPRRRKPKAITADMTAEEAALEYKLTLQQTDFAEPEPGVITATPEECRAAYEATLHNKH